MVALSVSTSAIKSPELTLSPSFLCHFAITPSVMVSLIFGIFTTSAIAVEYYVRFFISLKPKYCDIPSVFNPSRTDNPPGHRHLCTIPMHRGTETPPQSVPIHLRSVLFLLPPPQTIFRKR